MDNRHLLCLSFVAVLRQPLKAIPNLDGKFCRDLFGMPYETFNGMTPDGYVIAINNKPFPMIAISPTKIIFKAESKEFLIKYVEEIKGEFQRMGVIVSLVAFGINSEYQWLGLDSNADTWMWEHFINKNISTSSEYHVCNKINIRIGINESQFANVELAPRIGIRNGLFANINHHHNIVLDELPDADVLDKYIQKSDIVINSNVITNIIEN